MDFAFVPEDFWQGEEAGQARVSKDSRVLGRDDGKWRLFALQLAMGADVSIDAARQAGVDGADFVGALAIDGDAFASRRVAMNFVLAREVIVSAAGGHDALDVAFAINVKEVYVNVVVRAIVDDHFRAGLDVLFVVHALCAVFVAHFYPH